MSNYRLVFAPGETPVRFVAFTARDPGEAFLIAQQYHSRAQLWKEDEYVCTLQQSGGDRGFWVITQEAASR
jgi:hypothetical protein